MKGLLFNLCWQPELGANNRGPHLARHADANRPLGHNNRKPPNKLKAAKIRKALV